MTDVVREPTAPGATEQASLLDWATDLASNPELRSRFAAEPGEVLHEQGFADVPPADLHHSLPLVTDSVAARLGTEVDATAASAAGLVDGESPIDALVRQFDAATDCVTAADHDLDDPAEPTDHHPEETTMTSAGGAAAHQMSDSDWARVGSRAERIGYGDDVDRFLEIADRSDDPFTARYGDGMGDRYWQTNRGPESDSADHSGPAGHDTDLDDEIVGPGPATPTPFDTPVPGPEDSFLGWPDSSGGAGSAPSPDDDLDGFGTAASGSTGADALSGYDSEADLDFGAPATSGGDPSESAAASGDSVDPAESPSYGSSADASSDYSGSSDAGSSDSSDSSDSSASSASSDGSDYSESFG